MRRIDDTFRLGPSGQFPSCSLPSCYLLQRYCQVDLFILATQQRHFPHVLPVVLLHELPSFPVDIHARKVTEYLRNLIHIFVFLKIILYFCNRKIVDNIKMMMSQTTINAFN